MIEGWEVITVIGFLDNDRPRSSSASYNVNIIA